jgi:glycerophosphoryl diester phosphodiesterase
MFTDEFYEWKKSDAKNSTERFKVHAFFGLMKLLNMASKPLFAHLKKRGILCIYWVLNETKDFEKAIELGANGIMTDRPTLLKEYLDTKYKVA